MKKTLTSWGKALGFVLGGVAALTASGAALHFFPIISFSVMFLGAIVLVKKELFSE